MPCTPLSCLAAGGAALTGTTKPSRQGVAGASRQGAAGAAGGSGAARLPCIPFSFSAETHCPVLSARDAPCSSRNLRSSSCCLFKKFLSFVWKGSELPACWCCCRGGPGWNCTGGLGVASTVACCAAEVACGGGGDGIVAWLCFAGNCGHSTGFLGSGGDGSSSWAGGPEHAPWGGTEGLWGCSGTPCPGGAGGCGGGGGGGGAANSTCASCGCRGGLKTGGGWQSGRVAGDCGLSLGWHSRLDCDSDRAGD